MDQIKLVLYGRPLVQKNNLQVHHKHIGKGRKIPFVGHSKEMMEARKEASYVLHSQYISQGYEEPIDFLFEIYLRFFVEKRSEPDLDNLSAFVLDALQGIKKKGRKRIYDNQVIKDDKLLRYQQTEKILKGDEQYHGEPRTEITLCKYEGRSNNFTDGTTVSSRDTDSKQKAEIVF